MRFWGVYYDIVGVVDFVSVFGMLCLLGLFGCLDVGCFAVGVSLVVD